MLPGPTGFPPKVIEPFTAQRPLPLSHPIDTTVEITPKQTIAILIGDTIGTPAIISIEFCSERKTAFHAHRFFGRICDRAIASFSSNLNLSYRVDLSIRNRSIFFRENRPDIVAARRNHTENIQITPHYWVYILLLYVAKRGCTSPFAASEYYS